MLEAIEIDPRAMIFVFGSGQGVETDDEQIPETAGAGGGLAKSSTRRIALHFTQAHTKETFFWLRGAKWSHDCRRFRVRSLALGRVLHQCRDLC